jgi:hypothetical protein
MNKITRGLLCVVAAVAFAAPAHAQLPNVTPFSFEVRGGLAFPSGDFGESAEDVGELDVNDQGFNAGLRLAIPTPLLPVDPYVKGGLVFNKLGFTFDGDDEDFVDSDNSLGFEVGAGVGIVLGPKLSFTPQVTYTRYEPKYDGEGDDFTVQHIRTDVGLRIRL